MTLEPDYWTPEPLWKGQTAHVVASGPSATDEVIHSLRGLNVIVVNSTVLLAQWAPVWFFMDRDVLFQDRRLTPRISRDGVDMAAFAFGFEGIVVTTAPRVKCAVPCVRLVSAPRMKEFPLPGSVTIRHGRSSGHTAISLAVAMGANNVILHGYDMRLVDGLEHQHHEYEDRPRDIAIYERDFIPGFAGWNEQAKRAGVSITNATPGSALKEFPMKDGA